jgi:hypothetical protein
MRPLIIRAEFDSGQIRDIEVWPTTTPGLVVWQPEARTCGREHCWELVLARHGTSFGLCWDSPEGALRAAEILGAFGAWQHTWADLKQSMNGQGTAMRAAIASTEPRHHGMTCRLPKDGGFIDNGVIA